MKIDVSDDESCDLTQKDKLYEKVDKKQNKRMTKVSKSFKETKYTVFSQKKLNHKDNLDNNSISDSADNQMSIYSLMDKNSKSNFETPVSKTKNKNRFSLNGNFNFKHSLSKNSINTLSAEDGVYDFGKKKSNVKNPPLTCTKNKLKNNHFQVGKPSLYSPQSLSTFIFNPKRKTSMRLVMTLNFLKDKLGNEKFLRIKRICRERGFKRTEIIDLLDYKEKDFIKLIEYAFNEKSPSTQDSGSLNFDIYNMNF